MDGRLNLNKALAKYRVRKTFKENVEAEEVLLDASKSSEFIEQKIEVPINRKNFKIFGSIIAFGFLIFIAQTVYLQIIKGSYFSEVADNNYMRSLPVLASRGIFYDSKMKQLVFNIPSFDLVVTPEDLPRSSEDRLKMFEEISAIVGISQEEIKSIVYRAEIKNVSGEIVSESLDQEKLLALEEKIEKLQGFKIEKNATRQYLSSLAFSHIFGYLGKLTSLEAEENPDYLLTEKIGKNGLEYFYEKTLRGQAGKKLIEVDALGHQKRDLSESQPKDGNSLVLSIDSSLQENFYLAASRVLTERNLKKAAIVAINPKTGGVMAMLSFPSFDGNSFAQGLSVKITASCFKIQSGRFLIGRYPVNMLQVQQSSH
jgi:penicillin-binding protein 2